MFAIIAIITIGFAILYGILISSFRDGWTLLPDYFLDPALSISPVSFSIIIPARNEESNITDCLQDIINQNYPPENFEIIVVNDFSEDKTAERVQELIAKNKAHRIRLINLEDLNIPENNSFKKLSITMAIDHSRFGWIITSDADCRRGKEWLANISSFINEKDPVFISAPVCYAASTTFSQEVQALEFVALIGIGAASIRNNKPNMCNGANLIYKKSAFMKVEGFKGYDDIASGDDEFLMHKIHLAFPGRIFFLKTRDTIAYTQPVTNFRDFLRQRKRWVSKSRKYANVSITRILQFAWLFHFMLLFCLILGIFNWPLLIVFLVGFGIKSFMEFIYLKKITKFFCQERLLKRSVPGAFVYIFYVLFIGIYGNFGKYTWKGRVVR